MSTLLLTAVIHPQFTNAQSTTALQRTELAYQTYEQLIQATPTLERRLSSDRVRRVVFDPENSVVNFIRQPSAVSLDSVPTDQQLRALYELLVPVNDASKFAPGSFSPIYSAIEDLAGGYLPTVSGSNLLTGAGDFFIARAQDELVYGFLLRTKNDASSLRRIRLLFPRTWNQINLIDQDTYQTLTPHLRSAAILDLRELPIRLRDGATLDTLGVTDNADRDRLIAASFAYQIGYDVARGTSPSVAMTRLTSLTQAQISDSSTRTALQIVGAVAKEYGAAGGDPIVRTIGSDRSGLRGSYFVTFLAHDIVAESPDADRSTLDNLRGSTSPVLSVLNQLNALRSELDTPAEGSLRLPQAAIQVGRTAANFIPTGDTRTAVDNLFNDADLLIASLADSDYSSVASWLLGEINYKVSAKEARVLALAASLASAKTEDEVEAVLTTASSPIGSYRDKRIGPRSAAVVGYVGGSVGKEKLRGTAQDAGSGWAAGLHMPVGLEGSVSVGSGAISLFIPVVDLGTAANWRITDTDNVEATSEIGWRQVFAPGLYLVFNLTSDLPISFGLGTSLVSDLRRSQNDFVGDASAYDVARYVAFLGVDANLFSFKF